MFGYQRRSTKCLLSMCHKVLSTKNRKFATELTESKVKRKKPLSNDNTSNNPSDPEIVFARIEVSNTQNAQRGWIAKDTTFLKNINRRTYCHTINSQ